MTKYASVLLVAALSSTALLGITQQTATPKIKSVPIQRTPASSGQQMYSTYCAVCHGVDGKGNGPAAPALKATPTDLSLLSARNGGVFPALHVAAVLQFGVMTPAHGTAEMPIWGGLMFSLEPDTQKSEGQVQQRINNLTNYVKTLQQQ
jgi:mono/diheme cytochrome c family protein